MCLFAVNLFIFMLIQLVIAAIPNKTTVISHTHTHTHIHRFNGHRPGKPGLADPPTLIFLQHFFRHCASSQDRLNLFISSLTPSHHVFFGCPLALVPSTNIVVQHLISQYHADVPPIQTISIYSPNSSASSSFLLRQTHTSN